MPDLALIARDRCGLTLGRVFFVYASKFRIPLEGLAPLRRRRRRSRPVPEPPEHRPGVDIDQRRVEHGVEACDDPARIVERARLMHVEGHLVVILARAQVLRTVFRFGYQPLVTHDDPEDRLRHEGEEVLVETEDFPYGEGRWEADRVEVFLEIILQIGSVPREGGGRASHWSGV